MRAALWSLLETAKSLDGWACVDLRFTLPIWSDVSISQSAHKLHFVAVSNIWIGRKQDVLAWATMVARSVLLVSILQFALCSFAQIQAADPDRIAGNTSAELHVVEAAAKATLEKDTTETREDALLDIYRKLRPGEPPTVDAAQSLLDNLYSTTHATAGPISTKELVDQDIVLGKSMAFRRSDLHPGR